MLYVPHVKLPLVANDGERTAVSHCSADAIFDPRVEVRKNRPLPTVIGQGETVLWGLYLDNLEFQEILHLNGAMLLKGSTPDALAQVEEQNARWGSPGSNEKDENRALDRTILGMRTHGLLGRRNVPENYLTELMGLTSNTAGWRSDGCSWCAVDGIVQSACGMPAPCAWTSYGS